MIRVCAYCKAYMGIKETGPETATAITHGVCQTCLACLEASIDGGRKGVVDCGSCGEVGAHATSRGMR